MKVLTCQNCGHSFSMAEVWNSNIACCVHYCDGKEIADVGCPICRARVRKEIRMVMQ